MQRALNFVEDWCNRQGLSINAEKTTLVPYTGEKILNEIRDIFFSKKKLKLVGEVKYLKITVYKTVTYKSQVTNKDIKACKVCKRAIGTNWGLKPKLAHCND